MDTTRTAGTADAKNTPEAINGGNAQSELDASKTVRLLPNRKAEAYFYGAQTGTVPEGWSCRRHLHHMMFELNVVLEGMQLAEVGGASYRQGKDHLVLVPPMMLHSYRAEGPFTFFVMHVQADDPIFLNKLNRAKLLLMPPDHEVNRLLLPEMLRVMELAAEDGASKAKLFRCIYTIMDVLESFIDEHEDRGAGTGNDVLPIRIAQAIESLVANRQAEEAISSGWMEELAARLGFSRRHCYRVFRDAYSLSPREYLAVLRQQEAMHLLTGGLHPVEEVARRIGYDNVQSFIRQFVKWTGTTPGAFRKQRSGETVYLTPLELE
ncbi:helix-turn-helix domain-containing protein [Paenibacillus sacheonensis]|uniref:Helix-turn-helix domain-containing protein n=1 Tax=Paenibacillus sacheonensis TaxID=742054 RepID=A0A7X5C268_9BACL|nr:AraC family transcriptional regulator [Paenibacillus sacheonensis]MBM7567106.1 AraC-like DNA-binding protein [Paenibacillus sacheonensis]NBC70965.1 helix-turn-helix domain-containing protein [Paenibacillus sacheonensis]